MALPTVVILLATLVPTGAGGTPPMGCFACTDFALADAIANVILFAPFGAAAALLGWRWRRIVLAGAFFSVGIEFLQIFIPGRDANITDIVFNTTGALAGIALFYLAGWWTRVEPKPASRISLAVALAIAGTFALTAYLLQPSFPDSRYFGQWTARFGNLEWYRGRVIEATLAGLPLPSHELESSDSVRALLLERAELSVRVSAGPPVPSLAPIFSIADHRRRQIMILGADREDIVFGYRVRAAALRLNYPDLRVVGAVRSMTPGDLVTLKVRGDGAGYCVDVGGEATCGLGPTLGMGWTLLAYIGSLRPWLKTLLSATWLGLLTLPFGLWARRRWESALGLALITAGLAAIPVLAPLIPSGLAEYLGAAAGLVVGMWVQRLSGGFFHQRPGFPS